MNKDRHVQIMTPVNVVVIICLCFVVVEGLPLCLFVCLFVCLFACMFVCLFDCFVVVVVLFLLCSSQSYGARPRLLANDKKKDERVHHLSIVIDHSECASS